jgi:hypothetical protein
VNGAGDHGAPKLLLCDFLAFLVVQSVVEHLAPLRTGGLSAVRQNKQANSMPFGSHFQKKRGPEHITNKQVMSTELIAPVVGMSKLVQSSTNDR